MELYLSRVILNPASKAVMHDLGNPRELHKSISRWFPAIEGQNEKPQHERETPRNAYNLLHRLDQKGESVVLYVQSSIKPDWQRLSPGYATRFDDKKVDHLYAAIKDGDRLQFRLTANPTKRAGKNDKGEPKYKDAKRKRIAIFGDREPDENGLKRTREKKLFEWLQRKGEGSEAEKIVPAGFRIVSVDINDRVPNLASSFNGKTQFKKEKSDKNSVVLDAVTFQGVLEVTDAYAFRNALANGIGPGKAYGFGLMSVARA